jgi:general secretion pathway protein H
VNAPRPTLSRCSRCAPERGFTLIEILVVLVIVGIMVAIATLSLGVLGRDEESEDEARHIWATLQQAREEGELQGIDVGVFVAAEEYEFLRYDGRRGKWLQITEDPFYAPRKLPEGLRFRLWLESREIVMKPGMVDRSDADEDKKWPPQIMVLSNGDVSPFQLEIERDNANALWRVTGLVDTDLRVERRDAEDTREWTIVEQTKQPEVDKDGKELSASRR